MLKHALIIVILALAQFGCGYEYGEGKWPYEVAKLADGTRQRLESEKRQFLQIEDLKIGTGPVATWNRRISADLEVRYMDGSLVYRGPIFTVWGFSGLPEGGIYDERLLTSVQEGIRLGLNGMTVGGKRRITVDRSMVCTNLKINADPGATCHLVGYDDFRNSVRKEKLLVEATLTESCLPVMLKVFEVQPGRYVINRVVGCRDSDAPKIDPTLPTWYFY